MTKFKKILLIEDDPITILVCDRILKMTGFGETIVSKINGQEAIDYLHNLIELNEPLPEVIFLDINMPVKDGWQFLEEFKLMAPNIGKKIVIFMVSSSVDEYDIKKSKEYEVVTDYIIKPINKDRFIELITSAFNY